jgi:hypothetical protein
LSCEVDGPYSSASGDVKDIVDAAREVLNWGEVESAVNGLKKEVMLKI